MPAKIPKRFLRMMAARFAVLADPTRLEIIHHLMRVGEQNVTQIVEASGFTHANVSKHMHHLRDAEMVVRRKVGLQVFYKLDDPLIEKLCQLVCDSLLKASETEEEQEDS